MIEARILIGTTPGPELGPGEPEFAPGPTPEARRRRILIGLVVTALVLSGGGRVAARFVKSPGEKAAAAKAPASSVISAVVERRVLTDTVVLRGTVTAGQTVTVAPQVSVGGGKDGGGATKPVVTGVRVKAGDVLKAGQVLLEVSGRPVFVLPGELPVYRDLRPGGEGRDVEQLQVALKGLGYKVGTDKAGTYGAGTKAAVAAFYKATGYDAPAAGGDDAIKAAEERVTGAERALAQARDGAKAGGATSPPASGAADASKAAAQQVRYASEDLTKAKNALTELKAKSGAMLPAAEVVFLSRFPARVDAVQAVVGGEVKDKALTVSAGDLVVKGWLAPHEKGLVRPGLKVKILSELSGIEAAGEVRSIADAPAAANEEGAAQGAGGASAPMSAGGRGYAMIVVPAAALDPKLAGQDVRLTVEAASSGGPVLVVPVSAVSAGADGRTVVTVLDQGGAQRRVEIRPGTSGDGYVEVAPVGGGALDAADRVVVGAARKDAAPGAVGARP
ncbi:peptidoglycan-binding protein [Embleya sp. NBC_00896]|uniref:peptidoglycan-binding protein n=1 Tax=Embleya sp. NBC_00896 TaxID=2975961 RepID=UPI00386FF0A7|nr:peptidoglycan-binding protein [Embleya sp. NBC_00896]